MVESLLGRAASALSAALAAACLFGCTQEPHARAITGPDGSPMVHVSCPGDQSACFALAGRSCPSGYRLFPIFDTRDNNFLVRCQSRVPVGVVASAPALRLPPPAVPSEPAPVSTWTVETQDSAPSVPASRSVRRDSEIDLGY